MSSLTALTEVMLRELNIAMLRSSMIKAERREKENAKNAGKQQSLRRHRLHHYMRRYCEVEPFFLIGFCNRQCPL